MMRALNRHEANVGTAHEACESLQDRQMTTVWVYVDTSQQVGAPDHLKVFASRDAADAWFAKDDPESSLSSMT